MIKTFSNTFEFFRTFRSQIRAYTFSFFVTTFGRIVTTSLILRHWRPEEAGLWFSISSISYLALLLDCGVSRYFSNEAISRFAAADQQGAQAFYFCAKLFSYIISIAIVFTGLMICLSFDVRSLVGKVDTIDRMQASLAFIGVIASTALILVGTNLQIPLRMYGREAEAIFWENFARLSEVVCVALCAIGGGTLAAAGLGMALVRLVVTVIIRFRSPEIAPSSDIRLPLFEALQLFRRHLRKALAYLLLPAADLLSFNLVPVAVGAILGPQSLNTFTVLRIFSRLIWQIPQVVRMSVVNELSRCHGRRDDLMMYDILHRLSIISFVGMGLCGTTLIVVRNPFFHIWLGAHTSVPDIKELVPFIFAAVASGLTLLPTVVLEARNQHEAYCFLKLLATGIGVGAFLVVCNWSRDSGTSIWLLGFADLVIYLGARQMLAHKRALEIVNGR